MLTFPEHFKAVLTILVVEVMTMHILLENFFWCPHTLQKCVGRGVNILIPCRRSERDDSSISLPSKY